jgi:PPM family protein phosphatase
MSSSHATLQSLRPEGAMRSDVGAVRSVNEDRLAYVTPRDDDPASARGSIMVVADGMGGHAAGEVASELAVETICRVYYELSGPMPDALVSALLAANRAIKMWAESHPECKGMGSTCTALAVLNGETWLAHVGDSRAYLLRDGHLTQLSQDQTLVAQMVRDGELTPEEAEHSPVRNVILQALGSKEDVVPAVWSDPLPLAAGDVLVLCTDGLSGVVDASIIADHAGRLPPDQACDALINAALAAGAPDNVSVGVFRMVAAGRDREDTEEPTGVAATTRQIKLSEQTRNISLAQHRTRAGG